MPEACDPGYRMCRIRAPSFLPAERRRAYCPPILRSATGARQAGFFIL